MSTAGECAVHLNKSLTRFNELLTEGTIERQGRNGYDLDAVRLQYLEYIEKLAYGRIERRPAGKSSGALILEDERAKYVEQQRESAVFKLARERGEYVLIRVVTDTLSTIVGVVRERILAFEGKLVDALVMKERHEIIKILRPECIEVLNELRLPATYGSPSALAGSDEDFDSDIRPAAEPDADPMGRHLPSGF